MSDELQALAEHIELRAIDDDVVTISFTPKQRDLIVMGLKAAAALRALSELPPQS